MPPCVMILRRAHEQVNQQVEVARKEGALGARIKGTGFGGCYVVLCTIRWADAVAKSLLDRFLEAIQVA